MLVYSGTADAVFTTGGTRAWVSTLGLAPSEPFHAWRDVTLLNEVRMAGTLGGGRVDGMGASLGSGWAGWRWSGGVWAACTHSV